MNSRPQSEPIRSMQEGVRANLAGGHFARRDSEARCEGGRYEDRRCRNKVVIQAPSRWRAGEMMNLCQKHADTEAHRILMENHRLYWALSWQRELKSSV